MKIHVVEFKEQPVMCFVDKMMAHTWADTTFAKDDEVRVVAYLPITDFDLENA